LDSKKHATLFIKGHCRDLNCKTLFSQIQWFKGLFKKKPIDLRVQTESIFMRIRVVLFKHCRVSDVV